MEGTYGGAPDAACLRHLTRGKPGLAIKHGNVGRTNTHAETTLIVGEGVRVKGTLDGCDTLIVGGLVETSFKARSLQVLGGGGSAVGPLILLAVAIVFGLAYLARKMWRKRKPRRKISGI